MKYLTPKNILIALCSIYCVFTVERFLNMEYSQDSEIIKHEQEKQQMQQEINGLNNQIYMYEIKLLQKNASIDTMSNDGLDLEWSNIFR